MNLEERLDSFVRLGDFISGIVSENNDLDDDSVSEFDRVLRESYIKNNWFIQDNLLYSLKALSKNLNREDIESWILPYKIESEFSSEKRVLIVMAGNIPLVGFHDLISTLIFGCHAVVKLSSSDDVLLPYLWSVICKIDPRWRSRLTYINDLDDRKFDAIIAAGSDTSSRYFEYYFRDIPRLIRGNRNSISVLTGNETDKELDGLSKDIFLYFGLGCRSVSKLFLPDRYDKDKLFNSFYKYKHLAGHKKYMNNYDYNRSVFMMGKHKFLENGFCILREHDALTSPVSVIHFERYHELEDVYDYVNINSSLLQCVVGKDSAIKNAVPFGSSQDPELWSYADEIDTIDFLKSF